MGLMGRPLPFGQADEVEVVEDLQVHLAQAELNGELVAL